MIGPDKWLGLIGGGQLGRMFIHAAQRLGYRVLLLDPQEDCPASECANKRMVAPYDDKESLDLMARFCAAATTEFENVPSESLRYLARKIPVAPGASAVAIAQDRREEKNFFTRKNLPCAPYAIIEKESDIKELDPKLWPAILKTARDGYDGKGQIQVSNAQNLMEAWASLNKVPCVLEHKIDLRRELSVIVVRNVKGEMVTYPAQENVHKNGILDTTTVPSRELDTVLGQADAFARTVAAELHYVGVLCVELFVSNRGDLLINEIAPRPHNSGHYTIEACATSQFEQQVRAMTGLPLGSTHLVRPAIMLNLLGDLWLKGRIAALPDFSGILAIPEARLHLYGKREARPGRKMGHITITGHTLREIEERVAEVRRVLGS